MPTSRLSVVVPFYFGSVARSKMGGEERLSVSCIICNIYWMKYTVSVCVKNKIVSDSLLFTAFVQANVELNFVGLHWRGVHQHQCSFPSKKIYNINNFVLRIFCSCYF